MLKRAQKTGAAGKVSWRTKMLERSKKYISGGMEAKGPSRMRKIQQGITLNVPPSSLDFFSCSTTGFSQILGQTETDGKCHFKNSRKKCFKRREQNSKKNTEFISNVMG